MPDASRYVGRLAPAPTGALHLGNARTFLIAWLRARAAGGRLLLRLEDLDHPKVKQWAAKEAYDDLRWLGLDWDAGPVQSMANGDDSYVQSTRSALYDDALRVLRGQGLVYPCICSRRDLELAQSAPQEGDPEYRYPGTCRGRFSGIDEARREAGREPSWRFLTKGLKTAFVDGLAGLQASDLDEWSGDFVVAKGGCASYQLAVVVDDMAMGVTEVVRGNDLIASTHRQLALYGAFSARPPHFYHVPLVVGEDGRRLAKRHGDSRLSRVRERGEKPDKILGWLAWSCGWANPGEMLTAGEILRRHEFSTFPRERVVADGAALRHLGMA